VLDANGRPEIGWGPKPEICCAMEVAEGMGVRTSSPLVEECRKGVMEFLLINHPLDCPICDQAGECRLQEFSVEFGKGESRFIEEKVKKPKRVDLGERIVLDDERCIMCSRCIRFMKEIAHDDVLGFLNRGSHTTLSVYPGKKLDNNYSLNTVDICPVGALTSKDFRFKMRVWFLKETKSIDVNCGMGSNILISSRENTVHRITPRENDFVNSCWMPDSHRLNFHYLNSDSRLTAPVVKGEEAPAHWTRALAAAAEQLKGRDPARRKATDSSSPRMETPTPSARSSSAWPRENSPPSRQALPPAKSQASSCWERMPWIAASPKSISKISKRSW
jgi:NADH-quinone oxidoreductase subunit G